MKRSILMLLLTALGVSTMFAQSTEAEGTLKTKLTAKSIGWKKGGLVSINFTQAAYSAKWEGNPSNSMTLTSLVSVFANFSDGKNIWENDLTLGYGFMKEGSKDIVKSEDKLELTSKYGRQAFANWYYAALLNFKTQMTPTKVGDETVSEFLSPGDLLVGVGMDYNPNEIFSAYISPITLRAFFMKDIDTETNYGAYIRLTYKQDVFEKVNLESKLSAFSDYQNDPQNLLITWDNLLTMSINDYLNANISFNMVNVPGMEVVYKEVLGIGVAYKF